MGRKNPSKILKHFQLSELPAGLRKVGEDMLSIADEFDSALPDCAEKSAGLRKMLEARDCFIRAAKEEVA